MTGKKNTGATWHHTTVILREDIFQQACVREIDISDACNRALAGMTGIEYNQQQLDEVHVSPPVIIAKDGASPHVHGEITKTPAHMHPVINADDPAAPAKVVQAKTIPKKAPAEPPVSLPAPATPKEKPAPVPAATVKKAAALKDRDTPVKKRAKGDALKKFFSQKITRTDDAGDQMGKDELYEMFVRFCHEHRVTPVPERKTVTVALKNQFALTEKMVNGTACWTGILLK